MNKVPDPSPELLQRAITVRTAAHGLQQTNNIQRVEALQEMANSLAKNADDIIDANKNDLERSIADGLSSALISRLKLDNEKLSQAINGVRKVAEISDPLGERHLHRELDSGLVLERVTVSLGVLGVIFEARPDAVMQIASLAIRSGNGAILKGGKEAIMTNEVVMGALRTGLENSAVSPNSLNLLTTRNESLAMLRLDGLVDLIIPRGSNEFVRFIKNNTLIPVLGHADGICHLYVDQEVDLGQALRVALDSKIHYPAACNSIETLLLHEKIATKFLSQALPLFTEAGVTLRGDAASQAMGVTEAATEEDWEKEYLDMILAVRIVPDMDTAVEHIRRYGSRHTEAIVTRDGSTADRFMAAVDSAGVFHNCSTRFADGFRYGFGAEVGISTQTLPPRGPVGLEGLVTYRYQLRGEGHIAADYSNGLRKFTHIDYPL